MAPRVAPSLVFLPWPFQSSALSLPTLSPHSPPPLFSPPSSLPLLSFIVRANTHPPPTHPTSPFYSCLSTPPPPVFHRSSQGLILVIPILCPRAVSGSPCDSCHCCTIVSIHYFSSNILSLF